MKQLLAATAMCAAFATTAHASAVWDFFETSISCQGNAIGCMLDHDPVAEFVVPSDTSSGSASWLYGFPIFSGDPPPQHDGDDFLLVLRGQEITSQNLTGSITAGGNALKSYDISWDVSAGILNSVHVFYLTGIDEVKLFLTRGSIASDVELGGCVNTQCQVTGVWIDPKNTPIPEPAGTASAFLVAGLMWFGARSWFQRRRLLSLIG